MSRAHKKRATQPRAQSPRHEVLGLRLQGTGQEVAIPRNAQRFAVGSDPTNDLVLSDEFVSARHCVLERREDGRLVLVDRHSTNGTFVNGARVNEAEVEPGARILMGSTMLLLVGSKRHATAPILAQLIGEDPKFHAAIELASRAARTSAHVLILGESGCGKELFARLVHECSAWTTGPFVALNCGGIPSHLIESELFGHERGAFTGAVDRRLGVFEQADGGTLFLDEVGELPLMQQPSLLRVLETRRVRRVGGAGEHAVDVRVVAAANRDVAAFAERGTFRLDLYHRLAGFIVRLPPLRERAGDIPLLAHHFLKEAAQEHGPRTIAPATLSALSNHGWPGNVRELRNAIQRACALTEAELRLDDLLPRNPFSAALSGPPLSVTAREEADGPIAPLAPGQSVDELVRHMLEQALNRYGSCRRAAAALGMSKSTFYDRVRRLGLKPRRSYGPSSNGC